MVGIGWAGTREGQGGFHTSNWTGGDALRGFGKLGVIFQWLSSSRLWQIFLVLSFPFGFKALDP